MLRFRIAFFRCLLVMVAVNGAAVVQNEHELTSPTRPDKCDGEENCGDFLAKLSKEFRRRKRLVYGPHDAIPSELFQPVEVSTEQAIVLRSIPAGGINPSHYQLPYDGRIREQASASGHRIEANPQHISLTPEQLANVVRYFQQQNDQRRQEPEYYTTTTTTPRPVPQTTKIETTTENRPLQQIQESKSDTSSDHHPNFDSIFSSFKNFKANGDGFIDTRTFLGDDFKFPSFDGDNTNDTLQFARDLINKHVNSSSFDPSSGNVTVIRSKSSKTTTYNSGSGPSSVVTKHYEYDSRNGDHETE